MTATIVVPSADQDNIARVPDVSSLFRAEFNARANVILMPRTLAGDFNALALALENAEMGRGVTDPAKINRRRLKTVQELAANPSHPHHEAARQVQDDIQVLSEGGRRIDLRLERRFNPHAVAPDFHSDPLDPDMGRVMCCYNNPVTEWILNDDAVPSKIRGLHALRDGGVVRTFSSGDVWRMAGHNNRAGARPLLHRVPIAEMGAPPRLLLVVDGARKP